MRTFIGELIFRFKDDASARAKTAAKDIGGSVESIERAAKRLQSAPWGAKLQRDLEKLGATSRDLDQLRASWERLHSSMSSRNLSKAAKANEIASWSLAAQGHFAALASQTKKANDQLDRHIGGINQLIKLGAYSVAGGSLVYGGGLAVRGGTTAASEWERENFRAEMANIPQAERERINQEAERLGKQYPSVTITEIAELARKARSMMGDIDRGMAILPDLVKGLVTLQSAKGDAAPTELSDLLRGIDNAGKNGGALGVENTREIIAGLIRAAQVEGSDLDTGKLFEFARRGKIAVPGLSVDFLATTAPALMQDMTASGFGTALSSAYQAFVIGSNAVASKQNIQAQRDMGLRTGEGKGELVDASLFGRNPYAWVKKNLVPALEKSGVDMADETSVAQAVASLSRNTNATGLLTRMVVRQEQVDRLIRQYGEAMGPEAADLAQVKDPFVAGEGFVNSLRNLAAALGEDIMSPALKGLKALTGGINEFQAAWRDGDPMAKGAIAAGAVGGAAGAWFAAKAVFGLLTAGASLNTAAASLQAAAVALGGGANLPGGPEKKGKGWLAALLGIGSTVGVVAGSGLIQTRSSREMTPEEQAKVLADGERQWSVIQELKRLDADAAAVTAARERDYNQWHGVPFEGGRHRAGLGAGPMPGVAEAQQAGQEIQDAMNVTTKPKVDRSDLEATLALISQIKAGISGIGAAASAAHHKAKQAQDAEIRRTFSDYGVAP